MDGKILMYVPEDYNKEKKSSAKDPPTLNLVR